MFILKYYLKTEMFTFKNVKLIQAKIIYRAYEDIEKRFRITLFTE